jgi:hypothetical protein
MRELLRTAKFPDGGLMANGEERATVDQGSLTERSEASSSDPS